MKCECEGEGWIVDGKEVVCKACGNTGIVKEPKMCPHYGEKSITERQCILRHCPKNTTMDCRIVEPEENLMAELSSSLDRFAMEKLMGEGVQQESLAELADGLEYRMRTNHEKPNGRWIISLRSNQYLGRRKVIFGNTYAEAEKAAREYLNGLEDVK